MARATNTTTRTTRALKATRSTAKPAPAKTKAAAPKSAPPAKTPAERAPMVTKGELRTQIEQLEQTVAMLRAKSREANRNAKSATARIAELEGEVARLEKQVVSRGAAAQRNAGRSSARKSRKIAPDDAVPLGIAVQVAEPMDVEVEAVMEDLEVHPGEDSEAIRSEEEQGG